MTETVLSRACGVYCVGGIVRLTCYAHKPPPVAYMAMLGERHRLIDWTGGPLLSYRSLHRRFTGLTTGRSLWIRGSRLGNEWTREGAITHSVALPIQGDDPPCVVLTGHGRMGNREGCVGGHRHAAPFTVGLLCWWVRELKVCKWMLAHRIKRLNRMRRPSVSF